MGEGRERRGDKKTNKNDAATTEVSLKPLSSGGLHTTHPDPNVYLNAVQAVLLVARPPWHLLARPRPQGRGGGERRGAGRPRRLDSLPRAELSTLAPTTPGRQPDEAGTEPRARELDSRVGGSLRRGGGRRPAEASAVRLPVSSLFLPPTTAPRPRPRLPLQDRRPRAQTPHQRPGPPSFSLAPRYRRIGAAVRGSG